MKMLAAGLLLLSLVLGGTGCGRGAAGEETGSGVSEWAGEDSTAEGVEDAGVPESLPEDTPPEDTVLEERLTELLEREQSGAVVQVVAGNVTGSGVIVNETQEKLQIVTAAHVLAEGPDKLKVRLIDGQQIDCGEYQLAEAADLALLEITLEEIPRESRNAYQAAVMEEDSANLQTGDLIAVMGSRTAVAAQVHEGVVTEPWIYVEDYGQHMLLLQVQVTPGMSGGGVFDRKGQLLGIVSGANEEGEAVAVPVSILLTEFEEFFQ